MKLPSTILAIGLVACASILAEDFFFDDAAIRDAFRSGAEKFHDTPGASGLTAHQLKRALREERRSPPGFLMLDPASKSLSPEIRYERARKATLVLGHLYRRDSKEGWRTNLAGAVVLSNDGIVVTNYHVLDFKTAAVFAAMDYRQRVFPISEVIASNRKADVAILRLGGVSDLEPVPVALQSKIGSEVSVISHPDSHFYSLSTGQISRFSIDPETRARRIEITAPFARGSSGSGIFDSAANLIGIASATNAIYYEEDGSTPRNLQMVIHSGVPSQTLRNLLSSEEGADESGD